MDIQTLIANYNKQKTDGAKNSISNILKTYKRYINIRVQNSKITTVITTLDANNKQIRKQTTELNYFEDYTTNSYTKNSYTNKMGCDENYYSVSDDIKLLAKHLRNVANGKATLKGN